MSKKISCAFVLMMAVFETQAGVLGDLNSLFVSNTTAPSTFTTKDRQGMFGGSLFMRAPIQNITLLSFQPPRASAGCGGVDLFAGSFSFISSQNLVALFRNVAANSVGLAFKAAIKYISPGLDQLMTEFQSMLQNINNLAKNSCSLAHLIVDPMDKAVGSALDGEGVNVAAGKGIFSDAFNGATAFLKDANNTLLKSAANNPQVGNTTMKDIMNSGISNLLGIAGVPNADNSTDDATNPNSLNNRVLVSLMGYTIGGVPCSGKPPNAKDTPVNNSVSGSDSGNLSPVQCIGPPLIRLEDFILGGGANSSRPMISFMLYQCIDTIGSASGGIDNQICTQMQQVPYAYQGMRAWINMQIFGTADASSVTTDSILGKLSSAGATGVQYTASQKQFIKFAPSPLMLFLTRISDQNQRMLIAERLRSPIEDCMAAELGRTLYTAINGTKMNGSSEVEPQTRRAMENLRNDYQTREQSCAKDQTTLQVAQYLDTLTRLVTKSNR